MDELYALQCGIGKNSPSLVYLGEKEKAVELAKKWANLVGAAYIQGGDVQMWAKGQDDYACAVVSPEKVNDLTLFEMQYKTTERIQTQLEK